MANCPACNQKLHLWNLKAECPHCGANIPNHDWEKRLDEDALAREAAFYKLHSTLHKLKFSVVGNPSRILRFIFSFLPILGYVVPLASLKIQSETFSAEIGNINAIAFFTDKNFKIMDIFKLVTSDLSVQMNKLALLSIVFLVLSLLFGVIAFFLIPILCSKVKQPVTFIFHCLSLALYSMAPMWFGKFVEAAGCEGGAKWGIYIGIALFAIACIIDVIVLIVHVDELEYKYIPKDDVLQREYAMSIGQPYEIPSVDAENSKNEGKEE